MHQDLCQTLALGDRCMAQSHYPNHILDQGDRSLQTNIFKINWPSFLNNYFFHFFKIPIQSLAKTLLFIHSEAILKDIGQILIFMFLMKGWTHRVLCESQLFYSYKILGKILKASILLLQNEKCYTLLSYHVEFSCSLEWDNGCELCFETVKWSLNGKKFSAYHMHVRNNVI